MCDPINGHQSLNGISNGGVIEYKYDQALLERMNSEGERLFQQNKFNTREPQNNNILKVSENLMKVLIETVGGRYINERK